MATAANVFRDYETDGVPSSGAKKPKKSEIRQLLAGYESIINAFLSNGGLIYASKASLDADLAHAANSMAWVLGDATVANNGIYRKIGGSGTGSWTRVADLPFSFIIASDVGAGTANAIQATTSIPVSSSALVWMNIFEANTSSPVTVSFNGGSALTIKTNSGEDVDTGGLTAGQILLGVVSGSTFRLFSDQAIAASLYAARDEAVSAKVDAEAARDIAVDAASDAVSQSNVPIYSTIAAMAAITVPVGINAIRVNGRSSIGDEGAGLFVNVNTNSADIFTDQGGQTWYRAPSRDGAISMADFWKRGSSAPISAANKTALNAVLAIAVASTKAVYIPSGDWYCDAGAEILTGLVPIICDGTVYTNTTVPFITMKAVGGAGVDVTNFFIRGGTFYNLDGTRNQRGSSIIKFQSDGALISYTNFKDVIAYGFYQMFDDDCGSFTTIFGQESRMNHGLVDGCVPRWYGDLNSKYAFRRRTGSGTGWTYQNCRDGMAVGATGVKKDPVGTELLGYPAYVRIEGGAGVVAGDVLIDGHFSGLEVGAISIDGNCAYRSNISMTRNSQVDAQATRAIFFDPPSTQPVINMVVEPANIGGNIDILDNFPMGVGIVANAQGFGQARGGRYDAVLPSGAQSLNLCKVQVELGSSCEVEVWVSGIVQGVGIGQRKKVFSVRHDGAAVAATPITALGFTDPVSPGAGFFDVTATVSLDVVTFAATLSPTSVDSKMAAQYLVRGGVVKVTRLA